MRTRVTGHFDNSNVWSGPFYELCLRLGSHSGDRLLAALAALWSRSDLDGPYSRRDVEPEEQERITVDQGAQDRISYGIALLPDGKRIACLCSISIGQIDLLDFGLPFDRLVSLYEATYPDEGRWGEPLEEWLADIGSTMYEAAPFELGFIGEEPDVAGLTDKTTAADLAPRTAGTLLPDQTGRLSWTARSWH